MSTPSKEAIAREVAEHIDQLQQDGELGVPSLTKIIQSALDKATEEERNESERVAQVLYKEIKELRQELLQSRAAPASTELRRGEQPQSKLRKAAEMALDALRQLDMQPMNCRAYIRELEEALAEPPAQPQEWTVEKQDWSGMSHWFISNIPEVSFDDKSDADTIVAAHNESNESKEKI